MRTRLSVLTALMALLAASAWAAGCPAGSKQRCTQTKSGITCYCH